MNLLQTLKQKLKAAWAYNRGDGVVYFEPSPDDETGIEPSKLPDIYDPQYINQEKKK